MPRTKSPRTTKAKTETKILHMPENGNKGSLFTPADLESEIRLRAYELYEQRGNAAGSEQEDWLRAEQEIRSRHAGQTHTA